MRSLEPEALMSRVFTCSGVQGKRSGSKRVWPLPFDLGDERELRGPCSSTGEPARAQRGCRRVCLWGLSEGPSEPLWSALLPCGERARENV